MYEDYQKAFGDEPPLISGAEKTEACCKRAGRLACELLLDRVRLSLSDVTVLDLVGKGLADRLLERSVDLVLGCAQVGREV